MGHSRHALLSARSRLVLASRLAGIAAPIDGVTTSLRDATLIAEDCAHAVDMGFGGKLLIHPAQIGPARLGFAPSHEQITWAQRVLEADQTASAVQVDGAMVDAPVLARSRQILARAAFLPPRTSES
ncbi:MAG: CoA ester lyase, partial [Rhodobacteraceae bacterium]|nr:CoA ester lyase [Paracoccaceae bacterium]